MKDIDKLNINYFRKCLNSNSLADNEFTIYHHLLLHLYSSLKSKLDTKIRETLRNDIYSIKEKQIYFKKV